MIDITVCEHCGVKFADVGFVVDHLGHYVCPRCAGLTVDAYGRVGIDPETFGLTQADVNDP